MTASERASTRHAPAERYDFLVLGSGLAALSFALDCAEHGSVCVLTKRSPTDAATHWAQGGVAAVTDPDDSVDLHVRDTLVAGAGLCREDVVRAIVSEGPAAIRRLVELGVQFTHRSDGSRFDLGREGGHSVRRVLHAADFTGKAIEEALLARVQAHPNIDLFDQMMVVDLITGDRARARTPERHRCYGVYVIDQRAQKVITVLGAVTLLATGGAGKVYLYTTNPEVATGDGVAMAWRAGCRVANMEFFQFHPTGLFHLKERTFLISEALRGEGGVLRNLRHEAFMERYHPLKELAPRDVVARSIDAELKRTGDDHAWLDMTHLDGAFLQQRFPNIDQRLRALGLDLRHEPIPVVPVAHFLCGGVVVDADGRTSLDGLLAAGEVACTGLHGANRLASNSLLEAAVIGRRAAATAIARVRQGTLRFPRTLPQWNARFTVESDESVVISQNWDEIRRFMWNYVGIVRSNNRLLRARRRILALREEIRADYWKYRPTKDLIELRNLAQVAELIIESALSRQESRGLHYTIDYPDHDDARFGRDTILWRGCGA